MIQNEALLIIDMQVGAFGSGEFGPISGADTLLSNVANLIRKARASSVPIIFVQHCGDEGHPFEHESAGWHIHPLLMRSEEDILIQKRTPDSFYDTTLQEELLLRGIRRLVVAGLQTEVCIDTTCRRAFGLGYDVILAEDGHSTWDNAVLPAQQIIEHHNRVLADWFVKLSKTRDIEFGQTRP